MYRPIAVCILYRRSKKWTLFLDMYKFVLALHSKCMGVQYASPGKCPSPKQPENVDGVKASSPALYHVVNIKPCNMWDRVDLQKELKQGEDKDDAVLIFPSSSASKEDTKSMIEVVDSGTGVLCTHIIDICSEGDNGHKWIDCGTADSEGGSKAECATSCSTTRKLPNSILASLDRQHRLSVDGGLSGDTAVSCEFHAGRETKESEGANPLPDIDAADSLLIHEVVNKENKDCAFMESDSSEAVQLGGCAIESQHCNTQEHELVVEHASSNECDCFIPLSPSMGTPATVLAENCSTCGPVCVSQALDDNLSATVAQSSNTPSQTHQSLTDGVGPQAHTPVSCQGSQDASCWISPLLTASNSPKLLLFTDKCKQHRLVKQMMAEVSTCA